MPCIVKTGPLNSGLDIPLWTIESRSIPASDKLYVRHDFSVSFRNVPHITATAKGGLGLADISIINVTKTYVEIAISGPSPGMNVEMHAMSLYDPGCPCPTWITGIPSPCDGGPAIDPCCEEGDGSGGSQPWGIDELGNPCA